jgi:excinuclease ABC subunit A
LAKVEASVTARHLFDKHTPYVRRQRKTSGLVAGRATNGFDAAFLLGFHCFTSVTGVSGSGKSSLVSQAPLDLGVSSSGRYYRRRT